MNDSERAILAFEEQHPRNDRTKEAAIRTELDMSWVRYRQVLGHLVHHPDVLEEYAVVAHRVERSTARAVEARASSRGSVSVGYTLGYTESPVPGPAAGLEPATPVLQVR